MKSIKLKDIPTNFLTDLAALRNFDLSLDLVPGDVKYERSNMAVPRFLCMPLTTRRLLPNSHAATNVAA